MAVEIDIDACKFKKTSDVRLDCSIDLLRLFQGKKTLLEFKSKFENFKSKISNDNSTDIFKITDEKLHYISEQIIPSKSDKRPSVLFVFGNPAIQSIQKGMFFSSEGKNNREHRFWKSILPNAGIKGLNFESLIEKDRNEKRLRALTKLTYDAPCRIGLCVFISMPSPATGAYSGIDGVKRLFGTAAFENIITYERERVFRCIRDFITSDGAVFTFQKDAWNNLRSSRKKLYDIRKAKNAELIDKIVNMPEIPICGVPPTRLSGPAGMVLSKYLAILFSR